MSRQVDLTKPLGDVDREYLISRGRLNDIALNDTYMKESYASAASEASVDAEIGMPLDPARNPGGDGFNGRGAASVGVASVPASVEPPQLPTTYVVRDAAAPARQAGQGASPDDDRHVERNEIEVRGTLGGGPIELGSPAAYDSMTKAELQDELDKRQMPTSGNKDELVARLVEGDA